MQRQMAGAVRAPLLARAVANAAEASRHSAGDLMTDKHRTNDLDLNAKGLENRAKGTAEEMKGRARSAMGGLTDDTSEQLEGKAEVLKGKAQQAVGKGQQKLDGALDRHDRKAP